jgi:hypothetical protein
MTAATYLYELRRGDEIVATGHLAQDHTFEIGDRVTVAGRTGIVHSIIPIRGQNEQRLVVQLLPADDTS